MTAQSMLPERPPPLLRHGWRCVKRGPLLETVRRLPTGEAACSLRSATGDHALELHRPRRRRPRIDVLRLARTPGRPATTARRCPNPRLAPSHPRTAPISCLRCAHGHPPSGEPVLGGTTSVRLGSGQSPNGWRGSGASCAATSAGIPESGTQTELPRLSNSTSVPEPAKSTVAQSPKSANISAHPNPSAHLRVGELERDPDFDG